MSAVIAQLQTIAGLCAPVETLMLVTSTHWGQIARELRGSYKSTLEAPENLPVPANFQRLRIGTLLVANAGTEDEAAVNTANELAAQKANFTYKRQALISGKLQ